MTHFHWKITQIEAVTEGGLNNVIVIACFEIEATEGELKSIVRSDTKLLPADAESFVELSDVTQEQVVEWVKESLGEHGVTQYQGMAQAQIDSQKVVQPKVVPLPWL